MRFTVPEKSTSFLQPKIKKSAARRRRATVMSFAMTASRPSRLAAFGGLATLAAGATDV